MGATISAKAQMDRLRKDVAIKVRTIRENNNMNQIDLAYKMDAETSTISAIETARFNVNLLTLVRIADAMNLELKISFE